MPTIITFTNQQNPDKPVTQKELDKLTNRPCDIIRHGLIIGKGKVFAATLVDDQIIMTWETDDNLGIKILIKDDE